MSGTGSAGSGGTIQGTTADAVSATGTGPVSLDYMDFTGDAGDDVSASAVSALTVENSSITGGLHGVLATGRWANDSASNPQSFAIENDVFGGQQDAAIALTYSDDSSGYIESNFIGADSPSVVDGSRHRRRHRHRADRREHAGGGHGQPDL